MKEAVFTHFSVFGAVVRFRWVLVRRGSAQFLAQQTHKVVGGLLKRRVVAELDELRAFVSVGAQEHGHVVRKLARSKQVRRGARQLNAVLYR